MTEIKIKPFLHGPFSNWHKSNFEILGLKFNCMEQFMMFTKAGLFNDEETGGKILASNNPKEQKALGREVKNFDPIAWHINCRRIIKIGLEAKFTQNLDLLDALLETKDYLLVEGNKFDKIWGVGLDWEDPAIYDMSKWQGFNYLGFLLTDLREELCIRY
jgi:ribA/ribD-fused uncharacterized protein